MKALVVYSSRTGNTRKSPKPSPPFFPAVRSIPWSPLPRPRATIWLPVGYWVDKGMPDAQAKAYLETVRDAKVALFGTLGAWPGFRSRQGLHRAGRSAGERSGTPEQGARHVSVSGQGRSEDRRHDVENGVRRAPHDARTQGAPRRSGQASRRGRLPPGAGSLQGVRGTGGLTGQKDQRGSGPETGRAALPPYVVFRKRS